MPIPHFLETLLDRPIAYHRVFADLTKSVKAALMLSQALYWSKRTRDPDGWFYKPQHEWFLETGLSRREQDTARASLLACQFDDLPSFWQEERRGLPARIYYRLDFNTLMQHLERLHQQVIAATTAANALKRQTDDSVQTDLTRMPLKSDAPKRQSSLAESANQAATKAPIKRQQKRQSSGNKSANHSLQRLPAENRQAETSSSRTRKYTNGIATAASRFSEVQILDYLTDVKPHNKARNSGLAHKLWLTGEDDHLIAHWLARRPSSQASSLAPPPDLALALDFAAEVLAKPQLDELELQMLPGVIAQLANRPELADTVTRLKGLSCST